MIEREAISGKMVPPSKWTAVFYWTLVVVVTAGGLLWQRGILHAFELNSTYIATSTYMVQLPDNNVDKSGTIVLASEPGFGTTCVIEDDISARESENGVPADRRDNAAAYVTCARVTPGADATDINALNIPSALAEKLSLTSVPELVHFSREKGVGEFSWSEYRALSSFAIAILVAGLAGLRPQSEVNGFRSASTDWRAYFLILMPVSVRVLGEVFGLTDPRHLETPLDFVLVRLIVVPITEELYFRAGLLALLMRRMSPTAAIAVSATVFAFGHNWDPIQIVYTLFIGALLGWLWALHRSLAVCVLAHAAMNSSVITSKLLVSLGF